MAEKERGAPQSGDLVLSNEILARLPAAELDQIVVHLEHQHIPRHTVLCDPEKPIRLDVVLHGSQVPAAMSEVRFMDRFDGGGAPTQDFIELQPHSAQR